MRSWVPPGESAAKVHGREPFGRPDWHPPSYQTPLALIIAVQLARALACLARACWRHPVAATLTTAVLVIQTAFGSPGLAIALILTALVLLVWRNAHPHSYSRLVATPARSWWRGRVYAVRWHGVMSVIGLAVRYETRQVMPRLITVSATRCVDRVVVRLVRGQSPRRHCRRIRRNRAWAQSLLVQGPGIAAWVRDPGVGAARQVGRGHPRSANSRRGGPAGATVSRPRPSFQSDQVLRVRRRPARL